MREKKILSSFKGVIDSTLREGMQFKGADFSIEEQGEIVKTLTRIGVEKLEVGNPVNEKIRRDIDFLVGISGRPPFLAHVRNRTEDIEKAVDCEIEGVNILCTIDERRLRKMGLSFESYLRFLKEGIGIAQRKGLEVRVSVEDYFSQDRERSRVIFGVADEMEVERIGIADTRGVCLPGEVLKEVRRLKGWVKAEIEVHFHNDLGHASSNAIAALEGGANWVDTTICGIGERTGITPLSIFLANVYMIDGRLGRRYKLSELTRADNMVARVVGIEVPFNMLTNRRNGFNHKAGIHVDAVVKNGPDTYELFPPRVIGNERNLDLKTPISGKTSYLEREAFYERHGRG